MTTLFELVARDRGVGALLEESRERVRRLNAEIKKVSEGSPEYKNLAEQIGKTKQEISELSAKQRDLNREFKAAQFPADSVIAMRVQFSKLREQVDAFSEAERNSKIGQATIKAARELKEQIDKVEQATGRFTGQVGNYKKALVSISDIAAGVLLGEGIAGGLDFVTTKIREGIAGVKEYGKNLSNLSAITGVTGDALKDLEGKARDLTEMELEGGVKIVNAASDIFEAFKLVGSARPELLENADALEEVSKNALILSAASGDDLKTSVEGITTVLGQFNEESSASARIINELAAGSKLGASEITDTTAAIRLAGLTAKNYNVTTGETIALIETLADRQLKGAEAGTQLRNVFTKLASAEILPPKAQKAFEEAGVNVKILADTTAPLNARMEELGKLSGNTSALVRIFGLENLNAATILAQGVDKFKELNAGISGTNEAYRQASVNSDNLSTRMDNLAKTAKNQLVDAFLILEPELESLVGMLEGTVENAGSLLKILAQLPKFIGDNKAEVAGLVLVYAAFNREAILSGITAIKNTTAYNLLTSATARQAAVTQLLAAAQNALPYVALAAGIYAVIKAIEIYTEETDAASIATQAVADAQKEIADETRKEIGALKRSLDVLRDHNASQEQRKKAIEALQKTYPDYIRNINLETASTAELNALQEKLIDNIIRASAERQKAIAQDKIANEIVQERLKLDRLEEASRKPKDVRPRAGFGSQVAEDLVSTGVSQQLIEDSKRRLQELEKAFTETGKQFDRAFKLQQQDFVIVDPRSEEKSVDLRKKTLDELKELGTKEAEAEIARREKLDRDRENRRNKDKKDQEVFLEGTIGFLRQEVERLRKELERTPESGMKKVIDELVQKEADLKKLEDALKRARELFEGKLKMQADIDLGPAEKIAAGFEKDNLLDRIIGTTDSQIAKRNKDVEKVLDSLRKLSEKAIEDQAKKRADDAEKEKREREQLQEDLKNGAVDAAQSISDAIFEIQNNQINDQESKALKAIDKEYGEKIKKAKGNKKEIERLEAEAEKKKEAAEKEAAEKRRRIAIIEAIINTALAVVKALPNYILAAVVAIAGAAQIAVISSQKFAEGGFTDAKRKQASQMVKQTLVQVVKDPEPFIRAFAKGGFTQETGMKLANGGFVEAKQGGGERPLKKALVQFIKEPEKFTESFAQGGFGGFTGRSTAPPDETGRRPTGVIIKPWGNAIIHEDEYVAPASQVKRHPDLFQSLETERRQYSLPFADGGFAALPSIGVTSLPNQKLEAVASFTNDELERLGQTVGEIVAAKTAERVGASVSTSINTGTREAERTAILEENRKV